MIQYNKITIFRIVIVFLDVSKPHPATSQFLKFSIGVRNDPRKGSYKRDENIKIHIFISYKKGLSVQHAAPRPTWPPPLSFGASSYLCTIGVH